MSPTYRRRGDVVARQIAGEMFLVPIRDDLAGIERLFVLESPVAEHIWGQLEVQTSQEALCQSVLANYEVSPEQAEQDVARFLSELLAAGLIVEGS